MRIIGLDVGEKRIGIAKADSNTRIAVPIGFIDVDGLEWQEIAHIANLNNTNLFVIGLPRSNEGNETAQSLYARNFAKTLTGKIPGARVKLQDESLTSVLAEERLKKRQKKYQKGDIDAEAAAIILQDFLEGLGPNTEAAELARSEPAAPSGGVAAEVRAAVAGARETATALTKKEADRVKLNTKKAKHKMKTAAKWILAAVIIGLIAGGATVGVMWYKDKKTKERAEYYAALEAEMEAKTFDFTILPGETLDDIRLNLLKVNRNGGNSDGEQLPNYTEAEITEALRADYDFAFLRGRPEGASLEGYLYPETYNFYGDATVKEILTKYLEKMGETIASQGLEAKYAAQGLSLYEGVALASIVQKEASPPEQPTVAQVFLLRRAYGIPLGSDVTVSYALDQLDPGRHTYTDNQSALQIDSCYNTRVYAGLPCGPISNPGLSALLAVAEPSDTSYLYFLTGDDGLMYYSYTEAEHIQNIHSHCQNLCNVAL